MTAPIEWQRRDLLFRPEDHPSFLKDPTFAQSPQAIATEQGVRVYYSTRVREPNGKFASHISYVDFDDDLCRVLRVAEKPVIELGGLGCFDEHGIFPMSPLCVEDKIYAYTCGWSRRVSVSVETSIGLAISHDGGQTFQRFGEGPVLGASLTEPCLVGDAFVRKIGSHFIMWYIYGEPWKRFSLDSEPDRIYKIAMATSEDGIFWSKYAQNPIIDDALGETECQALPTMIENDGIYHLYFCFRHASDFRTHPTRGYRLGYAWSDDLKVWHRDDRSVGIERTGEPSAWDGQMMCYPHVFEHGRRPFLLYNGNAFGRDGFGVAEGVRIERSLAIRFSSNHATEERLIQHLGDCSDDYSTPLHMRVDLPAYAKKLFEKSVTFEAWNGDRLIGLLAAYLPGNDEAAHAFVSNVSVIGTFRRRGIAGDLLLRLHDQVSQRGLTQIQLDVDAESRSAISLYERFGYRHVSEHENQIRMCKPLQVKQESS